MTIAAYAVTAMRPPTVYTTDSAVAIAPTVVTPPTHSIEAPRKRAVVVKTTKSTAETKKPAPNPASTAHIGDASANRGLGTRRARKCLREHASEYVNHRPPILAR